MEFYVKGIIFRIEFLQCMNNEIKYFYFIFAILFFFPQNWKKFFGKDY